MTEQESRKLYYWYENKSAVILWLIFFFPVGLYGIWKSSQFSDKTKWIVTGCFVVLIIISGASDKKNRGELSKQSSSQSSPSSSTTSSRPNPQIEEQNPISWSEIDQIYNIENGSTDLQKKEAWKRFKGKKVVWSGTVSEVSDGFTGLTLQVKMNSNTLTSDVLIRLKKSQHDKALQLRQDGYVQFTGRLDDWGSIMPITIDDGEIL
ncbi:MAG: hypothetical protein LAE24_06335 [Candidatus Contendobacter sp.]|nr:hypothetical protein [Candidatus Contendobacter sp.]